MLYNSSKHGPIKIEDMPTPHVENALKKLERIYHRTNAASYIQVDDIKRMGALQQALDERRNCDYGNNDDLSTDVNDLREEIAKIKAKFNF